MPSKPTIQNRYYAAVRGDTAPSVQTTYIAVGQVPDRYALILSKPGWIWGARRPV